MYGIGAGMCAPGRAAFIGQAPGRRADSLWGELQRLWTGAVIAEDEPLLAHRPGIGLLDHTRYQMMMRRSIADRVGVRGIASEQIGLAAAAAEILRPLRAAAAGLLHPLLAAVVVECR